MVFREYTLYTNHTLIQARHQEHSHHAHLVLRYATRTHQLLVTYTRVPYTSSCTQSTTAKMQIRHHRVSVCERGTGLKQR